MHIMKARKKIGGLYYNVHIFESSTKNKQFTMVNYCSTEIIKKFSVTEQCILLNNSKGSAIYQETSNALLV